MKEYGFLRTAIAVPQTKVADVSANVQAISDLIDEAEARQAAVVVFPELSVTAYTCGDLFAQSALLTRAEAGVEALAAHLKDKRVLAVVGAPIPVGAGLYNCAVVLQGGQILGAVPKTHLPNSHEFYERRWFTPAASLRGTQTIRYAGQDFPIGTDFLFCDTDNRDIKIGVEICEDMWAPMPPSGRLAAGGATVIVNPSSSNELIAKSEYREELVRQQSARCNADYLYASCGIGESAETATSTKRAPASRRPSVSSTARKLCLPMWTSKAWLTTAAHRRALPTRAAPGNRWGRFPAGWRILTPLTVPSIRRLLFRRI